MEEVITSIKNRIDYLKKTSEKLTESQKDNITIELKRADDILKRVSLLCMAVSK